jgi:hypothetical protein
MTKQPRHTKLRTPRGTRTVRTYHEFAGYLRDFVGGTYPFLWVFGRPGVSKTEGIRAAVRGCKTLYRKGGQLSPLRFYLDCYHHRGQPVILDDAEHLLDDPIGAKLVSALADTSPAKFMCWATSSRALGDVPPTYYTTSPLCIISNKVTADEALHSRAVVLHFDPPNSEVHRAVGLWFWDEEIYAWFGRHAARLLPLDARWYVIAYEDKRAGRDWRGIVLNAYALDRVACLVQDLEEDPACPTSEDKARRFAERMAGEKGASRASYFRVRKRLQKEGRLGFEVVGHVHLRRTRPPGKPTLAELESLEAGQEPPESTAVTAAAPARENFAQPVQGETATAPPPPRVRLDDTLAWERPVDDEEGEENSEI